MAQTNPVVQIDPTCSPTEITVRLDRLIYSENEKVSVTVDMGLLISRFRKLA